jgi:hypothetical protein
VYTTQNNKETMMPLTINEEPYQYSVREKELLTKPDVSYWLKNQITESVQRDCLDALRDAQELVEILNQRTDRALEPEVNLLVKQMRKWNNL